LPAKCTYCGKQSFCRLPSSVIILLDAVGLVWAIAMIFTLTNVWMFIAGVLALFLLIVLVTLIFGRVVPVAEGRKKDTSKG